MDRPFVPERVWQHPWTLAGAAALLTMGVRASAALWNPILFDDAPRYLSTAQQFLNGDYGAALAEAYHPLTSLLIAGLALLLGVDLEAAGRVLAILSGGVASFALVLLAREISGPRVALLSGLLFAVLPRFVSAGSNVQSDGLHLALFLVGALNIWQALEQGGFRRALAGGVACGLAYLTRPEGLAIAVVFGAWLVGDLLRRRVSLGRFSRLVSGFAAAALLFGGPYLLLVNAGGGDLILSQKKALVPASLSGISAAQLAAACWEVMHDFQRGWELFWIYVVLGWRPGRPSRATLYLLSYSVLFLAILLALHLEVGYISRRHWIVPAALLLPFAGRGLLRVGGWAGALLAQTPLARVAAPVAIGLIIAAVGSYEATREPNGVKLVRREAALWLATHDVRSLASERARTAYYAGAERHVPLPEVNDASLLSERLRAGGADFLIAESRKLPPIPARGGLSEIGRFPYPGGDVLVLRVDALPDVAAQP